MGRGDALNIMSVCLLHKPVLFSPQCPLLPLVVNPLSKADAENKLMCFS